MTNPEIFTVISSLISILGICYLLFWRYRPLCMDLLRQDMFGLRDELFDYAMSGNIGFDHSAYGLLRTMTNGFIRFAHDFSVWQGFLAAILTSKEDEQYLKHRSFRVLWSEVTSDLSPTVKKDLDVYRRRMEHKAMFYFFCASPHSFVLMIPLLPFMIARHPDMAAEAAKEVKRIVGQREAESTRTSEPPRLKQVFNEVALLYGEHGHISTTGILNP